MRACYSSTIAKYIFTICTIATDMFRFLSYGLAEGWRAVLILFTYFMIIMAEVSLFCRDMDQLGPIGKSPLEPFMGAWLRTGGCAWQWAPRFPRVFSKPHANREAPIGN